MVRVTLDTNVVISGLFFSGPPSDILALSIEDRIHPVTSLPLLTELRRVLTLKFKVPPDTAELIINEWTSLCLVVDPVQSLSVIIDDPSDHRVLECAITGHANAIVSGDRHLLALITFRGIPILTPRAFLDASLTRKRTNGLTG